MFTDLQRRLSDGYAAPSAQLRPDFGALQQRLSGGYKAALSGGSTPRQPDDVKPLYSRPIHIDAIPAVRARPWLVQFYAHWCPHCHKLVQTWEQVAQSVPSVEVKSIDASIHKDAAEKYGVRGFPTIKLIMPNDEVIEYSGARSVDGIAAFLKKHI